jgi:hypothetical protein
MDQIDAAERDQRLDQLIADYIEAGERGEPIDVERWLLEHADFMAELLEFLRNYGDAWAKEKK